MPKPNKITPGPGQESVWDYPRPPKLEDVAARITVVFDGVVIADTIRAKRVLETSHPPNYYIPQEDIRMSLLTRATGSSICEWKGTAIYFTVLGKGRTANKAAWSYPKPNPRFAGIRNYVAFYAGAMDECRVDGERVTPQPGGFYGGWITRNIVGPFKGEPGTSMW